MHEYRDSLGYARQVEQPDAATAVTPRAASPRRWERRCLAIRAAALLSAARRRADRSPSPGPIACIVVPRIAPATNHATSGYRVAQGRTTHPVRPLITASAPYAIIGAIVQPAQPIKFRFGLATIAAAAASATNGMCAAPCAHNHAPAAASATHAIIVFATAEGPSATPTARWKDRTPHMPRVWPWIAETTASYAGTSLGASSRVMSSSTSLRTTA